ncbi:alpha/beta-hydrolase [Trametes punicea]|nr:alpha/beta-hydrolase [Trametes punicea]
MPCETSTIIRTYPSEQAGKPLYFVAKRYVPTSCSVRGLTLLLFHCTGSHKEVWEPVIHKIFEKSSNASSGALDIREAWTFDWQCHGEAGRLNAAVLAGLDTHIVASELVDGVKKFASEGVFDGHSLIGIGHSSGATSLVLTTVNDTQRGLMYKTLIILEPAMLTRESVRRTGWDMHRRMLAMQASIVKRRNTWASREEAKTYFEARLPWKLWDRRALDLFQTVENTDGTAMTRVTLCCPPFQEAAAYYGHAEIHHAAAERLQTLDPGIPVHMIFAAQPEVVGPDYVRKSLVQLRKLASLQFIKGVGHLLVQEKPDMVASLLIDILEGKAVIRHNL